MAPGRRCFGSRRRAARGCGRVYRRRDLDGLGVYGHQRLRLDEVAEQVAGVRGGVLLADFYPEQPVEGTGHEGQLQVAVDFEHHGGGQGIDVVGIRLC